MIEKHARKASDGVYHVSNHWDADPEPEMWPAIDDHPDPDPVDHTVGKAGVLRDAIDATQAIRHARAANEYTAVALSKEQIDAAVCLSYHPALHAMMDILDERYVLSVEAADWPVRERAEQYLELLGDE